MLCQVDGCLVYPIRDISCFAKLTKAKLKFVQLMKQKNPQLFLTQKEQFPRKEMTIVFTLETSMSV